MSRTNKHTKQQTLKTKIRQRKNDVGIVSSTIMSPGDSFDIVVNDLLNEFHHGAIRYGNKRHCDSYMKWKHRKADRYKNKVKLLGIEI